jgi:chemotaxis protein histidine kinase CheA
MDALLARFLPRFTLLARTRLTHALDVARQRNFAAMMDVVHELHTLAGEAGLLGLAPLVPLARDGEAMAKRLNGTRAEADAEALVDLLLQLATAVELVAPVEPPGEAVEPIAASSSNQ